MNDVSLRARASELRNMIRTEGKVQRLGREVPDDVGGVTSPQREDTLVTGGAREAVTDALVGLSKTTLLDLVGRCQEGTC